jgi:hypothetical protein
LWIDKFVKKKEVKKIWDATRNITEKEIPKIMLTNVI